MAKKANENLLVMQSGGPTPVINRSLYGVVQEASASPAFGDVYGAMHGMEGVLRGDLKDLRKTSKAEWDRIANTPAAALGSTRRKLQPDDVPIILDVLKKNGIGTWLIIGGNDSAETGHSLSLAAAGAGQALAVVNVPKTIDNDLVLMDHCPGYGSAARFIALATMGAGRDAESMGIASPITIIEVMGRDAGWLAAASALAKRDERDAPHVIGLPEVPIDEDRLLGLIENAYRRYGFAVAVIAENTRGVNGVLGGDQEPWYVDDFGHPYHDGPGRFLAAQISKRLGVRARYEKPGTIQRSMMACVSRTDAEEAEMAGRAAVQAAIEGRSDVIITLERSPGKGYACTTGTAPLADVGGKVKVMPEDFLAGGDYYVTDEFVEYARPLIGGPLPRYGRLR